MKSPDKLPVEFWRGSSERVKELLYCGTEMGDIGPWWGIEASSIINAKSGDSHDQNDGWHRHFWKGLPYCMRTQRTHSMKTKMNNLSQSNNSWKCFTHYTTFPLSDVDWASYIHWPKVLMSPIILIVGISALCIYERGCLYTPSWTNVSNFRSTI